MQSDGATHLLVIANTRTAPARNRADLSGEQLQTLASELEVATQGVKIKRISSANSLYRISQLVSDNFEPWRKIQKDLLAGKATSIEANEPSFEGAFHVLPIQVETEGCMSLSSIFRTWPGGPRMGIEGLQLSSKLTAMLEKAHNVAINRLGLLDLERALAIPGLYSPMEPLAAELIPAIFQRRACSFETGCGLGVEFDSDRLAETCILFSPPPLTHPSSLRRSVALHAEAREVINLLSGIYRIPSLIIRASSDAFKNMCASDVKGAAISQDVYWQGAPGCQLPVNGRWRIDQVLTGGCGVTEIGFRQGHGEAIVVCERLFTFDRSAQSSAIDEVNERARQSRSKIEFNTTCPENRRFQEWV